MALVPRHIKNLSPYKPGKPISEVRRELGLEKIIKLASNENPLGPSPLAMQALQEHWGDVHRYPDSAAYELRIKLAQRFNVKIENVIIGSGSEGIMSAIMRTFLFPGDEIVAAENSFIGFRVLAKASGIHTNWVHMKDYHYDLPGMAETITEYTKLIYLANPDNPTGTYFTKSEFDQFMESVSKNTLVILDEAYFEYTYGKEDFPDSMHYRYDNVITLRTFSKAYGLAGLRIGYGFAHEFLIENLMKVKLPFEPSILAQVAGIAALDDENFLNKSLDSNKNNKLSIESCLNKLEFNFIQSTTNFITIHFSNELIAESFTQNMLEKGIILRHLKGFGLPECVRITVGNNIETEYLIRKLKDSNPTEK